MSVRPNQLPIVVSVAMVLLIAVFLVVPVTVRHNAPLGVSRTIDSDRGIAVRGGTVVPNYDNFDRVDLDLRAYEPFVDYDFVVHVRPSGPEQSDIRTVSVGRSWKSIWHQKPALENPYLSVSFPPIADAAGRRFYVWVEAGPRNRDDIWTLWRIKSYSTVPVWQIVRAWIDSAPPPLGRWPGAIVISALLVGVAWALIRLVVGLLRSPGTVVRRSDAGGRYADGI